MANLTARADMPASGTAGGGGVTTGQDQAEGKLVVCFASKGVYKNTPGSEAGLKGLAELLHKYGFRATYYLKPDTVAACQTEIQEWNKSNGDEVG